jgi:hypothetical protein
MQIKAIYLAIGLAGLSVFPLTSQASLMIKLGDGVNAPVVVTDNLSGDLTSTLGVNSTIQTLGNWSVNVVSSANLGSTATSPKLELTSFNVSYTGPGTPAAPLKVFLTDTGYGPTPGLFDLHIGGTQSGGATIMSKYFYDPSNTAFGTTNQLGSTQTFTNLSYSKDLFVSTGGTLLSPYSLTLEADITNVPGGYFVTQFTSTLSTPASVPLPAAIWLFGSALAGLLGLRRNQRSA